MSKLLSCEYNMDTAYVEMEYSDSTMISIDTIAMEIEVADKCISGQSWTGRFTTNHWNMYNLFLAKTWRHT